jgi:hypothetical protein
MLVLGILCHPKPSTEFVGFFGEGLPIYTCSSD